MRGGDARRAERNAAEAWFGSVAIFVISYLYFTAWIPGGVSVWLHALLFVALPFFVVIFWLFALGFNSLLLKLVYRLGAFRSLPVRRGQAVLIATTATAMAADLATRNSMAGQFGMIWLTATAMNLVAATILALGHGASGRP